MLTGLLDRSSAESSETVLISGMAGVGKTALAVHWGHQVAKRFPDGQLYVDLHGYDSSGAPLQPAEAIREFMDALGVPAARIPAGTQAQAGLYRSLLASQRMLILLDNARDAAQVRPLLPGSAGCLVLVTSRNDLGLYQQLGDNAGQAHALLYLGRMLEEVQGRPREGLRYTLQARELFRAAGHKAGQANATSNAGWCHSVLGEHEEALACYRQALVLHREIDNRDGECCTWDHLGNYHRLGRHDQAITCYKHSASLFRELGNRPDLAEVLTHLGDTMHAAGHPDDARTAWQEAQVILDGLRDPSVSQILARLSRVRAA